MLAGGLLFGASGAIACADSGSDGGTGSSSPAGSSQGAAESTPGSGGSSATTGSTTSTQAKTAPSATPGVKSRLSTRWRPSTRFSPSRKSASDNKSTRLTEAKEDIAPDEVESPATDPQTSSAAGQTAEAAQSTEAPVSTGTADASATPSAEPAATANSGSVSAASEATPTAPPPPAPQATAVTPVSAPFQPVTNAVTTFAGVLNSVPGTLGALQTSKTPLTDAITSMQAMLTTVAGAVIKVPGDFATMLGVTYANGPAQPLIGASGALDAMKAPAPAGAPLFGQSAAEAPQVVEPAGGGSLFGTMAPHPTLGKVAAAGLIQPLSVAGTSPVTVTPTRGKSIFEHVIEAVLVPASLTALAALALPGLGALLVVAAAGVRVGYRQAKAGLALKASGIARFAGPGPLGVVRSGSMVALRQRARGPRTKRAVCPDVSRSGRTLERVA